MSAGDRITGPFIRYDVSEFFVPSRKIWSRSRRTRYSTILDMDITRWLQHAEAATPPEGLDENDHDTERPSDAVQNRDFRREQRHAVELSREAATKTSRRRVHPHKKPSGNVAIEASLSSSVSSNTSSSSESASHRYQRRARHKTRNDLYEPHSGARKRRSRGRPKGKSDKHRKTHHPTRKDIVVPRKPGKGMMQKFHADNVPQNRLTVRHPSTRGAHESDHVVCS